MMDHHVKKGPLGKGLSALIPQKADGLNEQGTMRGPSASPASSVGALILSIAPEDIRANPYQPRTAFEESALAELVASVRAHGILQPLLVTKTNSGYELIAGERRLRAAKVAGLNVVPAVVMGADEKKKLEIALIENIQRENLNPIETACAYKALIESYSLTQDDLAKRLGKSRSSVANLLRFLSLPQEIQESLAKGHITEGHGKIIAGLSSEKEQMLLWSKIVGQHLTVKDASHHWRRIDGAGRMRAPQNPNVAAFEKALEHTLGTKVVVKMRGERGIVEIHLFSLEDLGQIVQKITGETL